MFNIADSIFSKIRGHKRENETAIKLDAIGWAIKIGRAEIAGFALELKPHEMDHLAAVIEGGGNSEADFRATVDLFKKRCRQAELAKSFDTRKVAAESADREALEFDEAEAKRQQAAWQKSIALHEATRAAIVQFDIAVESKSDLIADAAVTNEERELCSQSKKVNDRASKLRDELCERLPSNWSGAYYPEVSRNCGALANFCRRELAGDPARISSENRTKLQNTLKLAEAAVAERQSELAAIEKEVRRIDEKLAAFNAAKLLPESITLVRTKPTRDELMQRHATRFGYGANDPGVHVSVG